MNFYSSHFMLPTHYMILARVFCMPTDNGECQQKPKIVFSVFKLNVDFDAYLLPFSNYASCLHLTFLQYLMAHSSLTSPPPPCLFCPAPRCSSALT